MVKAKKRRTSTEEIKRAKKKDRNIKLGTGFIIILLLIGFTVAAYWGFNPQTSAPEQQPAVQENLIFRGAALSGRESAVVEGLTDNRAVFGQLNVPYDLKERLGGDLYVLDRGLTHLIITNASAEEIESQAEGEYIIYGVGVCKGFDCLVENMTNESVFFDIYELNMSSEFLRTKRVGFPAVFEEVSI